MYDNTTVGFNNRKKPVKQQSIAESVNSVQSNYDNQPYIQKTNSTRNIFFIILTAISSWACVRYLHFSAEVLVWLILFGLEYFSARSFKPSVFRKHRGAFVVVLIFSFCFALSLVLGDHISAPYESTYTGLVDTNYISEYHLRDLLFFCAMLPGLFFLFAFPISSLLLKVRREASNISQGSEWQRRERKVTKRNTPCVKPLGVSKVLVLMAIIFVCWIPFLVVYWPGFIFADSIMSIKQALGLSELSNWHPVAYTLYLKIFLGLAHLLGMDNTIGIGLSSICQSLILSFVLGYLARWVVVRGKLKEPWGFAIALVFALTSYVATYGVALWKDPLFGVAVVMFTLCLADLVWTKGKICCNSKAWVVLFTISTLTMLFFRNNGILIIAVCFIVIAVLFIKHHVKQRHARVSNAENTWSNRQKRGFYGKARIAPGVCSGYSIASGILFVSLLIYFVVTGPVYSVLNVSPAPTSESLGVPLNQMARVAALDGDMTSSDRDFLNSMLPIEEYKNTYRPCCTDLLKFDSKFNGAPLASKDMWKHWFSMLILNPNVYFQAWELQTFGFWTVNTEAQANWSWSISGGGIRNVLPKFVNMDDLNSVGLTSNPAAQDERWHNLLLPIDSWSIPIGWLFWLVIYLVCCLGVSKKSSWILFLLPSIVNVATLLAATPIFYCPRYGVALQFLVPFFALVLYLLFRKTSETGKGSFRASLQSCLNRQHFGESIKNQHAGMHMRKSYE